MTGNNYEQGMSRLHLNFSIHRLTSADDVLLVLDLSSNFTNQQITPYSVIDKGPSVPNALIEGALWYSQITRKVYQLGGWFSYNSVSDPSRNQHTHSIGKDFQECRTYCYIFRSDRSLLCRVFGEYQCSCGREWWRTNTTNGYERRRIRAASSNAELYPTDGFHSHLECSSGSHSVMIQGGLTGCTRNRRWNFGIILRYGYMTDDELLMWDLSKLCGRIWVFSFW